eukprot:TRINITY_DN1143_c1_g1_i31.p1 TRINITY_DN1143_c1_g1~~TRINITY_DN1143_c1_g1_i31.p1  ORF type:complete len:132 (+),score=17.36 TRINITY_DN1143_c1_g1_i31:728-1123(+)
MLRGTAYIPDRPWQLIDHRGALIVEQASSLTALFPFSTSSRVPMHVIQQQLGHSNLAVTSRYINHLNPQETIAAMKARNWNGTPVPMASSNRLPPPGWLDRLRAEIGESRLLLFQDSRQDLENFRAVVLLF